MLIDRFTVLCTYNFLPLKTGSKHDDIDFNHLSKKKKKKLKRKKIEKKLNRTWYLSVFSNAIFKIKKKNPTSNLLCFFSKGKTEF